MLLKQFKNMLNRAKSIFHIINQSINNLNMGNSPQTTNLRNSISIEAQNEFSGINVYEEEYYQAYGKVRNYPHFFTQFLHQSPNFGKNLQYLFPGGLDSSEQYFQMVMYLRKYDPIIKSSQQAQQNCVESTLLDRFFMMCMGNMSFEKYKRTKLSRPQIQDLLLDYYMLFIKDPKPSSLSKVLKYIEIDEISDTSGFIQARKFAEKLREYFPHVHKYLRDYYMAKFHDGMEDFRVLKFFNSQILVDDAVLLALRIPQLQKPSIVQLYNSDDCGTSIFTLTRKLLGYTGPWLLLIKHSQKNLQDKKQTYVFGTYQSGPVKDIFGFQGDLNGFMFTIQPHIKFMTTGNGQGGENYFLVSAGNELLTKHRKGIGFGGNRELKNFKLWIDQDMDKSKVYNGYDMTYGYGPLAGQLTETLRIQRMQIWGLGTEENLRDQQKYWAERDAQKLKIRKVNKRQFLQESQLFLQNVYAYQDQVADIEDVKKRRSPLKRSPLKKSPVKQPFKGKQNKENELMFVLKENKLLR